MLGLGAAAALATTDFKPDWDQVANIKESAAHIGNLHRTRGAQAAYKFIDACYRTHGLAGNYSKPFEACIAQDYLETKMLAEVYARLPPDAFAKLGVPTPQLLADSMGRRIVAAFSQYKITPAYGDDLKKLVDEHGAPIFLKIVFPEALREIESKKNQKDKK
jgi:hypothetical protein